MIPQTVEITEIEASNGASVAIIPGNTTLCSNINLRNAFAFSYLPDSNNFVVTATVVANPNCSTTLNGT